MHAKLAGHFTKIIQAKAVPSICEGTKDKATRLQNTVKLLHEYFCWSLLKEMKKSQSHNTVKGSVGETARPRRRLAADPCMRD